MEIVDNFLADPNNKKRLLYLANAHRMSFIHIAFIINRGKLISHATNKFRDCARSKGCGWSKHSIHAEKNVVKELGDVSMLKNSTLYVICIARLTIKIRNSQPCHACKVFLEKCKEKYGLKHVFYST